MKRYKWIILFLAFCFAGCSSDGIVQEAAGPHGKSTLPAVQTERPTPSALPSEPAATPSPTAEPTPSEPAPPLATDYPEPSDEDFVRVKTYLPDLVVDLRYSTENNFTNQKIYDFSDVWLRYGTVKKLISVQEELGERGLYLKLWDGFRPTSAQFKLWEVCPDPTYVANPNKGFSSHSRGNTVDITLVDAEGTELIMPTEFDAFSTLADRDYSDCDAEAAANAMLLEETMKKQGFKPYYGEWWHFSDTQSYPVEQEFDPTE